MSSLPSSFTLTAPPSTDLWTKPPSTFSANAPIHTHSRFPLRSFKRARIGVSAAWTHQYDQGGLVLRLHSSKPGGGDDGDKGNWIKVGVEFYKGKPYCSTVGTDRWSDWSVYPVDSDSGGEVVVEVVKEGDSLGNSLWVYLVKQRKGSQDGGDEGRGEEKLPVREICWACADREAEIEVGAYCCRPGKGGGELEVRFSGFVVESLEE